MAVFETFSKRQRKIDQAGLPDMYQYHTLSAVFRRQVIYIWTSTIGPYTIHEDSSTLNILRNPFPPANAIWLRIFSVLARELGVFELGDKDCNPFVQCKQFLLNADTNGALDITDLSFHVIDQDVRKLSSGDVRQSQITQTPDDAIDELNIRFRENGIGYKFEDGAIIKLPPQYVHEPLVKPAMSLPTFRSSLDRFCESSPGKGGFSKYLPGNYLGGN